MNITFKLKEKSRANTLWLSLEYMSGDADAFTYTESNLGIPYSEWQSQSQKEKFNKIIENYQLINHFTDVNHELCLTHPRMGLKRKLEITDTYKYIKENYSLELADMFASVPDDSTCEGYYSHLTEVKLIGYDKEGNKYETENLLN